MVSDEALKKLQEQIAAWPMAQRFVVQQLIEDYSDIRKDLLAYKNTMMTPGEVRSLWGEWNTMMRVLNSIGSYDRLRELAEADKDGRLVVLPCKVGDTVYRIVRDADPHIARDEARNMYFADDMTLCVELVGGRIILSEKFGKTVFLTREAAEKALEAMKDE
jgi:hypothetical protein